MCLSLWGHPPTLLPPQGFPGTPMSRHLLPQCQGIFLPSLNMQHYFSTGSGCWKEPPPGPLQEGWKSSDSTTSSSSLPTEEPSSCFLRRLLSYKKFSISFYSYKQIISNHSGKSHGEDNVCTGRCVATEMGT